MRTAHSGCGPPASKNIPWTTLNEDPHGTKILFDGHFFVHNVRSALIERSLFSFLLRTPPCREEVTPEHWVRGAYAASQHQPGQVCGLKSRRI